ncbi:hypothetical protein JTB14_011605 [Gonioctena quinquepunctata]|nr:hypothetical protein JTB14_011605 [Gonioctena quinquepunctata]
MNPNIALGVAIENMEDNAPRRIINYIDAFHISDYKFKKNFRSTKAVTHELIEMVTPYMQERTRASGLSIERKVLSTLNFFATGSYQTGVGQNVLSGISQASVSSVKEVTEALNRPEIFHRWVNFPENIAEMNDLRQKYVMLTYTYIMLMLDFLEVAMIPRCGILVMSSKY